ncbi:MAG: hypothetical protein QOD13_3092, partial [Thermoleophilaceae bacterium]|nr:hypothetical protein [Thermoleophilaceae bacterium]
MIPKVDQRPLLDGAARVAESLRSWARPAGDGLAWPARPSDDQVSPRLYSGTAGVVVFLTEAALALDDARLADAARRGCRYLVESMHADGASGLYMGIAGTGFALAEAGKRLGDAAAVDGASAAFEEVRRRAEPVGAGVEWSPITDVVAGGAGTGLALLWAAERLGLSWALDVAAAAGARLMQLARPAVGGLAWEMSPDYPRLMPNFSHGTAGVAYFLASLGRATGVERFVEAAVAGATHLQSIARTEGGGCLIHHDEPDGQDLYYLGWCHGPVGTGRLFHRLHEVTGESQWREWLLRTGTSVLRSGAPEARLPGFWNNQGQCCGTAGLGEYALSLHALTGHGEYLALAQRCASRVATKATEDGRGLVWVHAENRTAPDDVAAQSGYMHGSAGIGSWLLHLDANLHRGPAPVVL